MEIQHILLCFIFVLFLLLMWIYITNIINIRNESEYKDIVEYQTMLVANLLTKHPNILPSIGKLRYFPDNSGFFIVLDIEGKILVHGNYDGDVSNIDQLPFHIPTKEIVEVAKGGGGYIRYNYQGYIYQTFVYLVPNSSYIVCSGLYVDTQHIQARKQWKRFDKLMLKSMSSEKKCPKV